MISLQLREFSFNDLDWWLSLTYTYILRRGLYSFRGVGFIILILLLHLFRWERFFLVFLIWNFTLFKPDSYKNMKLLIILIGSPIMFSSSVLSHFFSIKIYLKIMNPRPVPLLLSRGCGSLGVCLTNSYILWCSLSFSTLWIVSLGRISSTVSWGGSYSFFPTGCFPVYHNIVYNYSCLFSPLLDAHDLEMLIKIFQPF